MSQASDITVANVVADQEAALFPSAPEDSHFQLPIHRAPPTLCDIADISDDDSLLNLEDYSNSHNDSDDESWEAIPTPGADSVECTTFRFENTMRPVPHAIIELSKHRYDIREFHKSIERGDVAGVQAKLNMGMDIERESDNGLTPLVIAIKTSNLDMVRMLLDSGANPKQCCQQLPSIAHTIGPHERSLPILQLLICHGANPSARFGPERYNLLHYAVLTGALDVADLLVSEGMDIESTCSRRRTYGALYDSTGSVL